MRLAELITETAQDTAPPLPATPENIAAAKAFALGKWRERASETGRDEPLDLSSACKFCSWFAAKLFGGRVRGHFYHQWCELPDGRRIDLTDDAEDVGLMQRGEVPEYARYGLGMGERLPRALYTHRERFMRGPDARDSNASVQPRVDQWVRAFLASR